MTGLYDFEFSMIGDPMVDIATMGMRDSIEPLGSPLADLCRHYEEVSGEKVDHDVVTFHVLQFAALGTMQFAGTVAQPVPGDPHRSEEHTSELQSLMRISYAVFCLKKKKLYLLYCTQYDCITYTLYPVSCATKHIFIFIML